MTAKQLKTYRAVFSDPDRASIPWRDIESMFVGLGAEVVRGAGSRVQITLNGVRAVYHRPHPQKEAKRYVVRDVRAQIVEAGAEIDDDEGGAAE